MKAKIKRGDEVVVISGSNKGQRGKILQINLSNDRVVIEGVNMIKRHTPKTQENPEGAIVEREGTVHYSNVMLASRYDAKSK